VTILFTIVSIVLLIGGDAAVGEDNFFIDFTGYGFFVIFTFLACSLVFFSHKLIKTLSRLSGGKEDSENSHEVLLKKMILIFTITYFARAIYNIMQGHYYLFIPSFFTRQLL
jgi:hypothetical protein